MSRTSPPKKTSASLLSRLSAATDLRETAPVEQEIRILRHALKSFAARGYAATNVRAIAASAELTAPMINYYFESKEALYVKLAEVVIAALSDQVEAAIAATRGFLPQLSAVLRAHLAHAEESPEALGFVADLTYGPAEGRPAVDLGPLYAATQARIRGIFTRAIANGELVLHEGVSSDEAIDAFGALLNGLVLRSFEARRKTQPRLSQEKIQRRLRALFHGLGQIDAIAGSASRAAPSP